MLTLGLTEGDKEGERETEGLTEGDKDGESETEGLTLGEIDGLVLGETEGDKEGLLEGERLTEGETLTLGDTDGEKEGDRLGLLDGETEGLNEKDTTVMPLANKSIILSNLIITSSFHDIVKSYYIPKDLFNYYCPARASLSAKAPGLPFLVAIISSSWSLKLLVVLVGLTEVALIFFLANSAFSAFSFSAFLISPPYSISLHFLPATHTSSLPTVVHCLITSPWKAS